MTHADAEFVSNLLKYTTLESAQGLAMPRLALPGVGCRVLMLRPSAQSRWPRWTVATVRRKMGSPAVAEFVSDLRGCVLVALVELLRFGRHSQETNA